MSVFIGAFTCISALALITQWVYWHYIFAHLAKWTAPTVQNSSDQSATILLCARNEISNLQAHLPAIISQEFQQFKVLLVDDQSTDGTEDFIELLQQKERHLTYCKTNQNRGGKKDALATGIVKVDTAWTQMTDADCHPVSTRWLQLMINHAVHLKKTIILGYSPYRYEKPMLAKWSHFEAWITAVQYLSFCLIGRPYMAVGRNVLYHTSLLHPELFLKHADLKSGDDDLTMMEIANSQNTAICIDPDSFVYTDPEGSWGSYFRQKTRHFSTGHRYTWSTKILLSGFSISQLFFYVGVIGLLFSGNSSFFLGLMALRLLTLYPIVSSLKKKLHAQFSFFLFILFDFLLAIYFIIFSFAVIFPRKNTW